MVMVSVTAEAVNIWLAVIVLLFFVVVLAFRMGRRARAAILMVWLLSAPFGYGLTLAYAEREFPLTAPHYRVENRAVAAAIGAAGPVGLAMTLLFRGTEQRFQWW